MVKQKIKTILQASYQNPSDAKQTLENRGWKYDDELSSPEAKVFLDRKGRPNVAFRGSKRVSDYLTDAKLALGLEKYDRRFQEAQHLTKLVEDKYQQPVNAYGHSLGGSLAEKSGATGKIITHNKGTGIFDIGRKIPNNQIDIRNKNDIPSLLSLTQTHSGKFKEFDTGKHHFDILGNHKIL